MSRIKANGEKWPRALNDILIPNTLMSLFSVLKVNIKMRNPQRNVISIMFVWKQ